MAAPFVHLHNHSQFSLLDGACKLDEMIGKAKKLGMPALALTDHGNLFGAVHFYEKARKAGVKPIIGCEVYVTDGDHRAREDKKAYHLVLLARNHTGFKNLITLTSKAYLDGFYYKPRIDHELMNNHADGLVCLSACLSGQVNSALLREDVRAAEELAGRHQEMFGAEHYYIELQDHGIPEEQRLHREQIEMSKRLNIPLVCTNDTHYLDQGHAAAHDCLMCIQTGKMMADENRMKHTTDQLYLKSTAEMEALFGEVPDSLTNTLRIADMCDLTLDMDTLHLPVYELPDGFADGDAYLRHLCYEGLRGRYPDLSDAVIERIDYELSIIKRMGYAGYFLIVQDFIRYARSVNIPVGPGRGSAAGSLVAYATGITNIDPLEHGLLFERFLNPERVSMPDIDIDFSDRGRGAVIDYTIERYGADCVSQIITFGSMAARAVIRDVGRVMGLSFGEVDRIAKMVPSELGITLEKAISTSPDLQAAAKKEPTVEELISHARVLEGLSRHASTHAAGVVITPGPLVEYVPLYKSSKDEITTQWDMKAVEKVGLLKIDFLGLRTLTVIEDAVANVKSNRGVDVDIETLEMTDPKVYALFGRGDTVGVFQFESGGMREYLRKLKPNRFDDLIAMNALYRPGPLGSGMVDDYIERRHGRQVVTYPHPCLKPILEPTYGVIVYQEQVMQIASAMAGYSLGQADLLRRAMGKKIAAEMDEQRVIFVTGADAKGIAKKTANEVFDLMAFFAGYGFNKSHSAGYAYVAYQTAWLKAHYPVEFMAATMTSEMSTSDRVIALMNDCRRQDIPVDPPDVNTSEVGFAAVGERIRFALTAVKGVGKGAVEAILDGRRRSEGFDDLDAFFKHLDLSSVNKKALEALTHAGAMDAFGDRPAVADGLEGAVARAQRRNRDREAGQASLFGGGEPGADDFDNAPLRDVAPWTRDERLSRERATLGFYVSGHPLDVVERELRSLVSHTAEQLDSAHDGDSTTVGGIVTSLKRQTDKKNKLMARVTLEDYSGMMEVVVFSRTFETYNAILVDEARLLVSGKAQAREGERATIIAEEMRSLDEAMRDLDLHIQFVDRESERKLDAVRTLIEAHPGQSRIILYVLSQRDTEGNPLRIRLKNMSVDPDPDLVRALREVVGSKAVWLAGRRPVGVHA